MKPNKWIKASQKVYAFLLHLYPKAYREEFSIDMQQVFRAECQLRYEKKGASGILFYWLKVLPDLTYTALVEHVSSPTASWGLMEPVPDKPLPWKGVFLILLPCLVYLIAQISQFSGKYWYFAIYYSAGFLMMIPVLIVWAVTRRFPIWGLIPVGIFYHVLDSSVFSGMHYLETLHTGNQVLNGFISLITQIWDSPWIVIFIMGTIIFLLLHKYRKEYPNLKSIRGWTGFFAIFALIYVVNNMIRMAAALYSQVTFQNVLLCIGRDPKAIGWMLYEFFVIILLVCIGTLFLKRHGFFSIFVYFGYLLPERLIGYPWNVDELMSIENAMFFIGFAIITYRVLLSLVAPIWMSRTVSQNNKDKAVVIPVFVAVSISFVMAFYQYIFFPELGRIHFHTFLFAALVQALPLSGLLMAISLYRGTEIKVDEKGLLSASNKISIG